MRRLSVPLLVTLCGCAPPPPPEAPQTAPSAANEASNASAPAVEAQRLAENLEPNTKKAESNVASIAASRDSVAIDRATQTLTRYYTWLNSQDWQEQETSKIDAANRSAGLVVKERQLQGQFEHWRAKHLRHARKLLFMLGQTQVTDDALADASNQKLAKAARLLALDFLERDAPGIAKDKLVWAATLRKELNRPLRGSVANAAQVVGAMREPFRECYRASRERDPDGTFRYSVTIQVGPEGTVASVSAPLKENSTQEDPVLTDCVKGVARSAHFAKPEGGSAVINLPLTFVPN